MAKAALDDEILLYPVLDGRGRIHGWRAEVVRGGRTAFRTGRHGRGEAAWQVAHEWVGGQAKTTAGLAKEGPA